METPKITLTGSAANGETPPDKRETAGEVISDLDSDLFFDSTSVGDIQILASEQAGELLGDPDLLDELKEYTDHALLEETRTDAQKLEDGKSKLHRFVIQHDKAWNGVQATFTGYAIYIGKALNVLKELCKKSDLPWEEWANTHITFLKTRARQEYMLLARRTDAHAYAWIDKQKLMILINATGKNDGENPIGTFMGKHGITVDESGEGSYLQFKTLVDTALAMEKLEKLEVTTVDRAKVHALVQLGVKVESERLHDLKIIQVSGGDVNAYLDDLHRSGGKSDRPCKPQRKVEHFNKLTARIKGTIEYLMQDAQRGIRHQVDGPSLRALLNVLNQLVQTLEV